MITRGQEQELKRSVRYVLELARDYKREARYSRRAAVELLDAVELMVRRATETRTAVLLYLQKEGTL